MSDAYDRKNDEWQRLTGRHASTKKLFRDTYGHLELNALWQFGWVDMDHYLKDRVLEQKM